MLSALFLAVSSATARDLPLVAATTASSQQDSIANIVGASQDSVVLIETFDAAGGPLAIGSGFIVSADGRIFTNYHVIKGASSAMAKLANGALFPSMGS